MTLEFAKMTGAGNDFIVIDNRTNAIGEDARELAKQLCRRRLSVGADGLILIIPSTTCDFRMRYFNADGSEADMCGNGGRCVAAFAHELGVAGKTMKFESSSGVHGAEVLGEDIVRLAMTDPRAMLLNVDLFVDGVARTIHRVNTGVPHAVHEVDDVEDFPVFDVGRAIRMHQKFVPEGTNADFVRVLDKHRLALRTYERGVEDETLACGTGSVAAAVVMAALGKVDPPVTVETRGGAPLTVDFYMSDLGFCDVSLSGEARIVYRGELSQSDD